MGDGRCLACLLEANMGCCACRAQDGDEGSSKCRNPCLAGAIDHQNLDACSATADVQAIDKQHLATMCRQAHWHWHHLELGARHKLPATATAVSSTTSIAFIPWGLPGAWRNGEWRDDRVASVAVGVCRCPVRVSSWRANQSERGLAQVALVEDDAWDSCDCAWRKASQAHIIECRQLDTSFITGSACSLGCIEEDAVRGCSVNRQPPMQVVSQWSTPYSLLCLCNVSTAW